MPIWQLRRVVCSYHLNHLRYVIADGYYSKRKFLDGVGALGLHQIGKLRRDANLRYLYQGVGRPGPGRPKTYDGKVQWDDLSRFERVQSEDDGIVLYHQVLNHMHLRRNLRVVLVVDTRTQRWAVLVQHRYRLGCADALSWLQSALPNRVSLQRRQAVYVSECLSSALPSEAACSFQCQYECSYPGSWKRGSKAAVPRQAFPWPASNVAPSTNICLNAFLSI